MRNDTQIHIRLTTGQKEKLAVLAEQQDRSVSQVIRLAIESYIARKEEK